jgi:hypothetical protein
MEARRHPVPDSSTRFILAATAEQEEGYWWPILNEAKLSDRLATMPVRIRYMNIAGSETWREDWPEVSPQSEQASK